MWHILSCNTSKCADFLPEKQRMGVFVKMFHFVPFYVHFWSKLTPKVSFSLKHGAFLLVGTIWDLRLKMFFWEYWQAHTKFCVRICIFSTQNGLRTPQFDIFRFGSEGI